MTHYPRAFQYRHVPAAPPRMAPTKQVFEFNVRDARYGPIPEWQAFLRTLGILTTDSTRFEQRMLGQAAEIGKSAGAEVRYTTASYNDMDDYILTITVTHPKPRISTKLAATFPWKMRKHLKKV